MRANGMKRKDTEKCSAFLLIVCLCVFNEHCSCTESCIKINKNGPLPVSKLYFKIFIGAYIFWIYCFPFFLSRLWYSRSHRRCFHHPHCHSNPSAYVCYYYIIVIVIIIMFLLFALQQNVCRYIYTYSYTVYWLCTDTYTKLNYSYMRHKSFLLCRLLTLWWIHVTYTCVSLCVGISI